MNAIRNQCRLPNISESDPRSAICLRGHVSAHRCARVRASSDIRTRWLLQDVHMYFGYDVTFGPNSAWSKFRWVTPGIENLRSQHSPTDISLRHFRNEYNPRKYIRVSSLWIAEGASMLHEYCQTRYIISLLYSVIWKTDIVTCTHTHTHKRCVVKIYKISLFILITLINMYLFYKTYLINYTKCFFFWCNSVKSHFFTLCSFTNPWRSSAYRRFLISLDLHPRARLT